MTNSNWMTVPENIFTFDENKLLTVRENDVQFNCSYITAMTSHDCLVCVTKRIIYDII